MTATVRSKAQLTSDIATAFPTGGKNTAAAARDFFDDLPASFLGCHGMLQNLGVNKTLVLTSSTTELGVATTGASPWDTANTLNNTLTTDVSTGRVTCPSDAAAGYYQIGFSLTVAADTTTAPFQTTLSEQLTLVLAKGAAGYFGTPGKALMIPRRPITLPVLQSPLSATTTAYVPALAEKWTADSLIIMSASAVSGGTDAWTAMQVTNLALTGSGTNTLFASAQTTNGNSLTAGLARRFPFDQNTAVAGGETLKLALTKTGAPAALEYVAVRGYQSVGAAENCYQLHGVGQIDLASGDYFSLRGNVAGAFGTITVQAGYLWWRRVGGA